MPTTWAFSFLKRGEFVLNVFLNKIKQDFSPIADPPSIASDLAI